MAERRYPLKTRVFLDSSVLFTAVNSPIGGSAKLFTRSEFELVTSPTVLTEVERNVGKKLLSHHMERYQLLVQRLTILPQRPQPNLIKKARKVIVSKDAVILSEAQHSRVPYIITLDLKHFFTPSVKRFLSRQIVLTPKMLLEMKSSTLSFGGMLKDKDSGLPLSKIRSRAQAIAARASIRS